MFALLGFNLPMVKYLASYPVDIRELKNSLGLTVKNIGKLYISDTQKRVIKQTF